MVLWWNQIRVNPQVNMRCVNTTSGIDELITNIHKFRLFSEKKGGINDDLEPEQKNPKLY